jgi:hypothetical protein
MNTSSTKRTYIYLVVLLIILIGIGIVVAYFQPQTHVPTPLPITMGPDVGTMELRVATAISDMLTATAKAPIGTFTPRPSS